MTWGLHIKRSQENLTVLLLFYCKNTCTLQKYGEGTKHGDLLHSDEVFSGIAMKVVQNRNVFVFFLFSLLERCKHTSFITFSFFDYSIFNN